MTRVNWVGLLAGTVLVAGLSIASGPASGGGNTGGGGATGGGGTGGGGTTAVCTPIQSLKIVSGYYKGVVGALWTNYSLQPCNGALYIVQVKATDLDTGLVSYVNSSYLMSGVLDYDFAPFNSTFRFDFTVIDRSTGAVLDSRSVIASAPPPPPAVSTAG